jgi:hypothetical protein
VLTHSASDKVFKLWGLTNYELLYALADEGIQEVKTAPGLVLLVFARAPCSVRLELLAVADGTPLLGFEMPLLPGRRGRARCARRTHADDREGRRGGRVAPLAARRTPSARTGLLDLRPQAHPATPRSPCAPPGSSAPTSLRACLPPLRADVPLELVELFGDRVFVQQAAQPLSIVHARTGARLSVCAQAFAPPSAFIYLDEHRLFLTFRASHMAVWDLQGRCAHRTAAPRRARALSRRHPPARAAQTSHLPPSQPPSPRTTPTRTTPTELPPSRPLPTRITRPCLSCPFPSRCPFAPPCPRRCVTRFDDHALRQSDVPSNNVLISDGQQLLLSYCLPATAQAAATPPATAAAASPAPVGAAAGSAGGASAAHVAAAAAEHGGGDGGHEALGSPERKPPAAQGAGTSAGPPRPPPACAIHVSSILTGKCLARIGAGSAELLRDVTALWYNEEANELYVGNKQGAIQLWSIRTP